MAAWFCAILGVNQRSSVVEQRFRNLDPEVPFHRVPYRLRSPVTFETMITVGGRNLWWLSGSLSYGPGLGVR